MTEPTDAMEPDQTEPKWELVSSAEIPLCLPITPPPAVPPRRPGPGLPLAIGVLLLTGAAQVAGVVAGVIVTGITTSGLLFTALATMSTLSFACFLVEVVYGSALSQKLAIRWPDPRWVALTLLLVLPLVLISGEGTALLVDAGRGLGVSERFLTQEDLLKVVDEIRTLNPWTAVILVGIFGAIMPAVGEELLFRGLIGRGLVARWGRGPGIALTSLLFGIMHVHPVQAMMAMVMGVCLHVLYFWSRSLLVPMLLHMVYNSLAFLGNVLSRDTSRDLAADEHMPPLLTAAALFAMFAIGYVMYRSRVRWVFPDRTAWSPDYPSVEAPPPDDAIHLERSRPRLGASVVATLAYMLFLGVLAWYLRNS